MTTSSSTVKLTPGNLGTDELSETLRRALATAIIDSSEDAIICKTLDGRIRSWNDGATRLFGYQADEIVGKHITALIPEVLHPEEDNILARLGRGERIDHFETTRLSKDGRRVEISLTVSPVRDDHGIVIAASSIAREIGSRRLAERATAQLAAIVESSEDAIVSKSLDGTIQSWNEGARRIFGYGADEAVGQPITMLIPPELHEEERLILAHIRKGKRINHFDTIRVAKDGHRIPISLTVSPVRDKSGAVIGASKVARDISDRKHFEQVLQDNERQLFSEAGALARLNERSTKLWRCRRMLEGLNEMLLAVSELLAADAVGVGLMDDDANLIEIAAHRELHLSLLQAIAMSSATDSPNGEISTTSRTLVIDDVEDGTSFAGFRAAARDTGYRAAVCVPLLGGDGERLGTIASFFRKAHRPDGQQLRRLDLYVRQACDFIQRCRTEDQLRQHEETLLEADRRKDEFLALLAHELRNPLAPIRYALAATKKETLSREQRVQAEDVIDRQVTHMSRLLDDLLDVSRITRGRLELKTSTTELAPLIEAAIETARPILDAKEHCLSVALPESAVYVEADAVRLAQVFSNLLINAAKYTDSGGTISVRASVGDDVIISIRDSGIGIAADMMPKLFTMFTRSRDAIGRSEAGLGVGLALVEGLVALHGGTVEARSDGPGEGSEFIVRLPRTSTKSVHEPFTGAAPKRSGELKVLVVDDNRDAAETCRMLLELCGHHVEVAHTAQAALEQALIYRPDVCLLDIGLPDRSGYELAQELRSKPSTRDASLIALTGFGQEDDRRRALAAGFDRHLTKPIDPELLESLIQSLGKSKIPS